MRDNPRTLHDPSRAALPSGFVAIGIFLFFAATMATLAAISLLWHGTFLDRMWTLNPTAYRQLAPLRTSVGTLFAILGMALITAGIGWFGRQRWGWRLAVAIIAVQVIGDLINCLRGDWLRGGIGVAIAGALLLVLFRPTLKSAFS